MLSAVAEALAPKARKRQVVVVALFASFPFALTLCFFFRSFRRNLNGSIRSRRKDCILTPKILRKRPIKQQNCSTQLSSTLLHTSTVVSCCIKHIIKEVVKSDHSKTIQLTKKKKKIHKFWYIPPLS